jgi:beta-lactam-binding protein with PASTA domain
MKEPSWRRVCLRFTVWCWGRALQTRARSLLTDHFFPARRGPSERSARIMKLWKFLLLLMGLAVVALAALLGLNFLLLPQIIHQNQVVVTPDIRGMTVTGARTQLKLQGLEVEVARQKPHPSIPEGMILDQIPAPEKGIRSGRTVMVITSNGPPAGALPDLTALSLRQAEITLQHENFKLGRILRIRRAGVTEPVVDFQNPGPGVRLVKGAVVDLVVAEPAAPDLLRMPDLEGMSLFRARQIINEAGFVLAPVTFRRTGDMAPNLIIEQNPPAGLRIRKGEQLELVASSR